MKPPLEVDAERRKDFIEVIETTDEDHGFSSEEIDRALLFLSALDEKEREKLNEFVREEMAGKIAESGLWIWRAGYQAGLDAFHEAMGETHPELEEMAAEMEAVAEKHFRDVEDDSEGVTE